ncbi:hypothetical protein [Paracoccus ravus]|uniref:hypothetical protein n=1 Tax=Paracoccus ravus TaxID=2447760 RepID=UPI00106ED3BA|nr:hypothetical protein [Paracoccus ravus]
MNIKQLIAEARPPRRGETGAQNQRLKISREDRFSRARWRDPARKAGQIAQNGRKALPHFSVDGMTQNRRALRQWPRSAPKTEDADLCAALMQHVDPAPDGRVIEIMRQIGDEHYDGPEKNKFDQSNETTYSPEKLSR